MPDVAEMRERIVEALQGVIEPASNRDVVALGFARNVGYCDGVARVDFELPQHLHNSPVQEQLRRETTRRVLEISGMKHVEVNFAPQPAARTTDTLPGVKHVIAVGAGKGGVGKSTVSVLLAAGLLKRGVSAGLLDADVYGPSIPKMTRTESEQPYSDEQGRIIPPEAEGGLKIMSMGYIVPADQAVIWRGPMAQKYVKEFLDRGSWGSLDYLIVDLPPGTGDIPLTLAQSIPLTGAIVVCTPQDVALLDAIKAHRMYQKLGVESLGMVENMSYYFNKASGEREYLFGRGGVEKAARELGTTFLGGIPLNPFVRECGDAGTPFDVFKSSDSELTAALDTIIDRLLERVDVRARERTPLPQLKISG